MKTVITEKGLEIIGQNGSDPSAKYWIGYYGLAYVPDENRADGQSDQVSAGMQSLTVTGDNIYNLFQGSMKPEGFNTDIGDSAASKLYNECMYTGNIMSRYRYMLDQDTDKNTLVVFSAHKDTSGTEDGVQEYARFDGVDMESASKLPVPAPLYYKGEPKDYGELKHADVPTGFDVSCDTRSYSASDPTIPQPSHEQGDDVWDGAGKYDWAKSEGNVYEDGGDIEVLTNAWQFQSVSNYNRFHAPASAEGYAVGYDPACRNMAKATKLFPIGHYDVLSTKSDEKVGQVQYTVEINMKSVFTEVANRTQIYYDAGGHKVSGDSYKMSFKFNRIGIYAVPVALHAYTESESQNVDNCANYSVQMQANGNDEPVLFAVMDLDSPIVMSEDGVLEYKFNFNVDFSSDASGVVDSASIYYNLYEDDAITWYKNQLIANASTANAITNLGVQMAYLRKQVNKLSPGSTTGCSVSDKGSTYLFTGRSLKNIEDIGDFGISSKSWDESIIIGNTNGVGSATNKSISVGATSTDITTSFVGSLVNTCDAERLRVSSSVVEKLTGSIWWSQTQRIFTLNTTNNLANLKDVFVFLGNKGSGYADSDWLGVGKDMETVGGELSTSVMQPYNAPMIFTGGLALGGYGNGLFNFGLLKLGTDIKTTDKLSDLYDSSITQSIVSVKSTQNATVAERITPLDKYNTGNYVVHSPHAGKVLTVLEDQELDGTLHIGLKLPMSSNIVRLLGTDGDTEYELHDETKNIWAMPDGCDFISDIQELLGNDMSPVIKFDLDVSGVSLKGPFFAQLCEAGLCGYMFVTDIPYIGKRYICVRYTVSGSSASGTSTDIQVSVSSHNITIGDGEIH